EKRWPGRVLAGLIDHWKNRGLTPDQVPAGEAAAFANGRGKKLYAAFQERRKSLNAAHFGDLLLEMIRLFRENPEVLGQYQRRFRYILVDEYQDTNVAQYLWLRLIAQRPTDRNAALSTSLPGLPRKSGNENETVPPDAGLAPEGAFRNDAAPQAAITPPKNICCVGDDDQSIYGWRGAEVDNILRFDHDFPGARVIRLERNYRSTGHILAAASHLIAHNEGRLGKTLHTEDVPGEKVTVTGSWDSEEEARSVGEEIEELQRKGHPLNEIAILVRASFQMREFEDRFITLGLNYRVIGGPRFYERAEIRDALAYLRAIHSPSDDLAFERIVNVPKRGIGDASVQLLHEHARRRRVPLFEAARAVATTDELKPKARSALRGLIDSFDAAGRLENLKELVRSMEEFENLAGFLEHISLVMDTDRGEDQDAVNIMTLHSAKGLEFDTVFLPGWEEGLFPHQRALDEQGRAGLEEERRLAHVGLTRARRRAKIYFATNRRTHGLWQTNIPSRFLDELPAANVEVTESKGSFGGAAGYNASRFDQMTAFGSSYGTPGWQRAQANKNRGGFSETGTPRYGQQGIGDDSLDYAQPDYDDDDMQPSPSRRQPSGRGGPKRRAPLTIEGELVAKSTGTVSAYSVGDRVFHLKFGNGNVIAVDGNKLTIAFDKAGEKRVVDSFVERV
ncbi:MAG: UvrD-helicase domain-containing protein, partial [Rhizobiales bacterium]|nr:UvrD-helicase domain-containing protein [Hyphomicrobiales bacterium]